MFCSKCGSQISDNAQFCSACGTPIKKNTNNNVLKSNSAKVHSSKKNAVIFVLSVIAVAIYMFAIKIVIPIVESDSMRAEVNFLKYFSHDYYVAYNMNENLPKIYMTVFLSGLMSVISIGNYISLKKLKEKLNIFGIIGGILAVIVLMASINIAVIYVKRYTT